MLNGVQVQNQSSENSIPSLTFFDGDGSLFPLFHQILPENHLHAWPSLPTLHCQRKLKRNESQIIIIIIVVIILILIPIIIIIILITIIIIIIIIIIITAVVVVVAIPSNPKSYSGNRGIGEPGTPPELSGVPLFHK